MVLYITMHSQYRKHRRNPLTRTKDVDAVEDLLDCFVAEGMHIYCVTYKPKVKKDYIIYKTEELSYKVTKFGY